jgi:alkylhydroperoxidase family enzyme
MTRLSGGVADGVWTDASEAFADDELGDLLLAICGINTWNRIAISTRKPLPS